ncbi:MAG TPA: hypothetical protein VIG08_16870 [Gemmatimonadales bacterium]
MLPTLAEATSREPNHDQPERGALTRAAVLAGCRCERYFAVAVLTPVTVDRAFPVVLREPVLARKVPLIGELLQLVRALDDDRLTARVFRILRYGCLYTGELTVGTIQWVPGGTTSSCRRSTPLPKEWIQRRRPGSSAAFR